MGSGMRPRLRGKMRFFAVFVWGRGELQRVGWVAAVARPVFFLRIIAHSSQSWVVIGSIAVRYELKFILSRS